MTRREILALALASPVLSAVPEVARGQRKGQGSQPTVLYICAQRCSPGWRLSRR